MASYNFYNLDGDFTTENEKIFNEDLFGFSKISLIKINDDFSGFHFYRCSIEKEHRERIFVRNNDQYIPIEDYKKVGLLDVFVKEDRLFIQGAYMDRQNLERAFKNITAFNQHIGKPQIPNLDLLQAAKDYQTFKSLSVKDFSATISRLKTSGQMSIDDEDISAFLERSDAVTDMTIVYPHNDGEFDIHIDSCGKIRLKDSEFDGTVEDRLLILEDFRKDFIQRYKK